MRSEDRPSIPKDNTTLKPEKLSHVMLEVDFLNDPKFEFILAEFGAEGIGFCVSLWAAIGRSNDSKLPNKEALGIGLRLRLSVEKSNAILKALIEHQLIYKAENSVTHHKISDAQVRLAKERERFRNNKKNKKIYLENPSAFSGESPENLQRSTIESPENALNLNLNLNLNPNLNSSEGGQGGDGRIQILEHCFISETDLDQFLCSKGKPFMDRCFEKVNAWVEESKGTPQFSERARRARNCSALFANWVFRSIAEEQARAEQIQSKPKSKKLSGEDEFNLKMEELAKL